MLIWFFFSFLLQGQASPFEFVLPNGLKVAVEQHSHIPQLTMRLRYTFDPAEVPTGVPHMVEHLMFEGSTNVSNGEYDRVVRSANGQSNARTGLQYILLETTLDKGALDTLLFLESDRMKGLCGGITEEDIHNQKSVIAQEMWNLYFQEFGMTADRLRQGVFSEHPVLGNDVMGGIYDIEQIDAAMICEFAEQWLQPQHATLVLVGDIDPVTAKEKIGFWFSDIDGGERTRIEQRAPQNSAQNFYLAQRDTQRLYIVWAAAPQGSSEEVLVDTVMELLVHPELGLLRQKGYRQTSGWSENFPWGGWVAFEVVTDEPQELLATLSKILEQPMQWLNPDQLIVHENRNEALLLKRMQFNEQRAEVLSACLEFGTATDCYQTERHHRMGITPEDIQKTIEQYFSMTEASILYIGEENLLQGEDLP